MRVLIVEDDPQMGRVLEQGLEEEGFAVERVETSEDAVAAGLATEFDVISLDLMIPGEGGIAVCRSLRSARCSTPVLMLTARDALDDRVRGLESGADDYLVKPFAFEEYVARLRALTRRHLAQRGAVLDIGDLVVDTRARTAMVGDRRLRLTAKEYAILEYLAHNPGQLLTRDQIAEHVWSYRFSSESNLVDQYIARLRRKLESERLADAIETVRYAGYRLRRNPRCAPSSREPASA